MFGSCVFPKFLFFACFAFSGFALAQTKPVKSPYLGRVVNEGSAVYRAANFDSPVIAYLSVGKTFQISTQLVGGAFYRIRVSDKQVGYISDADVVPLFKLNPKKKTVKRTEQKILEPRRKKPFSLTEFAGPQFSYIGFREETMALKPTENLSFFGVKLSGPNILLEGAFPTEINLQFHWGAPDYYKKATGKEAVGWMFLSDFLFQTYFANRPNAFAYFGFGPLLKYSKFDVILGTTQYSLENFDLGLAFKLGGALRLGKLALRGEAQYYWEKMQYRGLGFAIQFPF